MSASLRQRSVGPAGSLAAGAARPGQHHSRKTFHRLQHLLHPVGVGCSA
jgi:hypothetical protein